MSCENGRALVPSYLDGELSEEQAGPLRAHLLACPRCREAAKEGNIVKRWFAAAREEEPQVPSGFAARVARRAFAGDPGVLTPTLPTRRESILPFVLVITAIAAGLLLTLSVLIKRHSLPTGGALEAQQRENAPWDLERDEDQVESEDLDEDDPDEDWRR